MELPTPLPPLRTTPLHSPGTRTCRDPGVAQTLSAASTCWSRACAVSRNAHRLYRAGPRRIIYASPVGVSKKFDSVARYKIMKYRNRHTNSHTYVRIHIHYRFRSAWREYTLFNMQNNNKWNVNWKSAQKKESLKHDKLVQLVKHIVIPWPPFYNKSDDKKHFNRLFIYLIMCVCVCKSYHNY